MNKISFNKLFPGCASQADITAFGINYYGNNSQFATEQFAVNGQFPATGELKKWRLNCYPDITIKPFVVNKTGRICFGDSQSLTVDVNGELIGNNDGLADSAGKWSFKANFNPAATPILTANMPIDNYGSDIVVDGDKLYCLGINRGLQVFDLTDPAAPILYSQLSNDIAYGNTYNLKLVAGQLYLSSIKNLSIYRADTLELVSNLAVNNQSALGVSAMAPNIIYYIDNTGLWSVDMLSATAPVKIWNGNLSSNGQADCFGDWLYFYPASSINYGTFCFNIKTGTTMISYNCSEYSKKIGENLLGYRRNCWLTLYDFANSRLVGTGPLSKQDALGVFTFFGFYGYYVSRNEEIKGLVFNDACSQSLPNITLPANYKCHDLTMSNGYLYVTARIVNAYGASQGKQLLVYRLKQ